MSDTPSRPVKKYQPSCGAEEADFQTNFCYQCVHDKDFRDNGGDSCEILMRTFVHDVDDPEYPEEWQYDRDGRPTCTAFRPEEEPE